MSRALLYRTSLIQTVPTAQAEAASKALYLGREGGRYASIARVFLPVLKRIPPSAELSWFAPEIIRAFLSCGEQVSATPWFSLLRTSAQHNQEFIRSKANKGGISGRVLQLKSSIWNAVKKSERE